MEALSIVILIILILIAIKRKKYFFNPVTIFSGIWIIIIFLANLKLFDMVAYDEKIIFMILIANISFLSVAFHKKDLDVF